MVTHLSYIEETYRNAEQCLAGIRSHIEHGWELSQLRGPQHGPYLAVFRMQDALA
ncbi:MAG: hypothetical protein ABI577_13870 [bacterium]